MKISTYSRTALLAAFGACTIYARADFKTSGVPEDLTKDDGKATITAYQPEWLPGGSLSLDSAMKKAGWQAKDSATPLSGTVDVTKYVPNVHGIVGDLSVVFTYTPGAGDPAQLPLGGKPPGAAGVDNNVPIAGSGVWLQNISSDKNKGNALSPYLDISHKPRKDKFPTPLYPFQYNGSTFKDDPTREADAWWLGQAWLVTEDPATKTVTVFGGVEYGFYVIKDPVTDFQGWGDNPPHNAVPAGAGWMPFLSGLIVLRRRRSGLRRRRK